MDLFAELKRAAATTGYVLVLATPDHIATASISDPETAADIPEVAAIFLRELLLNIRKQEAT